MSETDTITVCDRCARPVTFFGVSDGYYAACEYHDEDLYQFETTKIERGQYQWVCAITDEVMDDFGNIVEQDEQCIKCDMSYDIDNIIYAKQDGTLSSSEGDPYCEGCLPEQPNY